jgi:hypothetical protein
MHAQRREEKGHSPTIGWEALKQPANVCTRQTASLGKRRLKLRQCSQ